jgi:hypothetical protein
MKWVTLGLIGVGFGVSLAAAGDVGFVEDFALAKDRAVSLRQLIPGTDDYYFYHCLHYLNTEQFEKVEALMRPWLERFPQSPRLSEIRTRQALLSYERDPQRSLTYLRNRLGLRFDHQKEVVGGAPQLPVTLDQKLIARATLRADSMARWKNLDNFEDSALDWLAADNLDWERRRNLLQRLQRPDIATLPKLVADDFNSMHPVEFGALGIHRQMTLAQLEELLRLRAGLLNHVAFVQTWISKLHPGADEDWRHDPARTRAYLDRLLGFVRRLAPVHNALKAHVLYQRLVLDRSQGVQDKELFLEYLKLPRQQPYMAKALLEADESRKYPADLNANFQPVTLLPIVGPDEPLVRAYLKEFFVTADTPKEFEPFINDVYLKHLFAETKIENGLGDAEQWASQLPPEAFRQLKERIDIDFAPTNKTSFAADEAVRLDLHVKNVPTLIVKVFEINTLNFYRTQRREVDTDINLDGLVANAENTHKYAEPPLRRLARRFEFPQLNKPGVYVIDFIGSGKSSRALIRKGRLRPLVTTGTAGEKITVIDELNRPVKKAAVWLGGQEYLSDADGTITVPFSTNPGRQPIVLSQGDFACLDYFQHQAENLSLTAGIHVDREALLAQRIAAVLIRPGLQLDGQPVSVSLLEDVRLRIIATDHDGIATSTEVPNFKLFEDRESVYELRVPARLDSLNITLRAKVKNLSQNRKIDLATGETFALNGIAKTEKIEDLHLAKFGADYVLELLGRTGEPKVDRPVQLALKHRDFREAVRATLKTDGHGRVQLGALAEIVTVTATGPEGTSHVWTLPMDHHSYRQVVHSRAGEVIALPYLGAAAAPSREELALFEMRGAVIQADRFDAMAIRDGMIEIRDLPAGDYDLWLKRTGERIRVRVVDGPLVAGHALGRLRHLQLPGLKPVQIAAVTADADNVTIRLHDVSPFTRVHVYGARYLPAFSPYTNLGRVRDSELKGVYPAHAESVYIAGRNIGDEYRYVLDRKYHKNYPGNMLERPALLLNPWAVRSTETGEQLAHGGDEFRPAARPPTSEALGARKGQGEGGGKAGAGDFANLDFLADASAVLLNLVPDKDGMVRFGRKQVNPHAMLHVVAIDPLNTTYRTATLAEQPSKFLDLRLHAGLDPKGHFTQQKQVSVLPPKQPFVLADAAGSRFEYYDSLARVYTLYATLSNDPKLAEFSFVLTWPKLKIEEKRTLYSKYACHELNFFLAKKDPEFFQAVVRPYLANKKDKTFLDRWLLDDDLRDYVQPWQHGRLNTVERVLLAQRLAGEPVKTARHINDLVRLQPPNADRVRMLFETAVKGSALAADDALGLEKLKESRRELESNKRMNGLRIDSVPVPTDNAFGRSGVPAAGGMAAPQSPAKAEADGVYDKQKSAGKDQAKARNGKGDSKEEQKKMEKRAEEQADRPAHFFDNERAGAKLPPQLYRRLDPTQEWAESNYYHLLIQQQLADLVPVSGFWLDYARHDGRGPFLSRNVADASRNFTEMMFALAVLELPFTADKHEVKFDGGRMAFTPAGAGIGFHEEVRPVGGAPGKVQILVSQNFYRHGDRYREENGERFDKFVTGEFVIQTVYGCQLVITNPTPSRQRLAVLIQTPVGSVPVANGQPTRTVQLDLEPYHTQTVDYLFYFPMPGRFAHFPVHVAKNEALVASAAPFSFEVVEKPSKLDTESWQYVSQNGTAEQVLAFLNRENVNALNLDKIAFRMKDKDFFTAIIALLQERHLYQATLWSYGLFHNAVPVAREYLLHADQIVAECGGPIVSPLLTIDPVARHQYEYLEYKPLVNARAHSLGQRRQIVNGRFHEQYHRFLKLLGYRPQLTDDDRLAVSYYLLLQDRIEEALALFAQVNPDKVPTRLQYDYCAAYLDLFSEEPRQARTIAGRYIDHPVDRWRNAFTALANQLDEIDGKGVKVADLEDRGQRQTQLASKEAGFEFTLDSKAIHLGWQNVESVRINYYLMDVELLFSRNPFVQESGQFASIRPNLTQELKLPADQSKMTVKLPDNLVRRNVLVEVAGAGKTRALPYYANAMDVRLTENYGQLRVTDTATSRPLSKVYVKTYVRLADGQVKFHKDGYTDQRGRFDYASVSTPERVAPNRFAILVLSDEHGALIREAGVPQQ